MNILIADKVRFESVINNQRYKPLLYIIVKLKDCSRRYEKPTIIKIHFFIKCFYLVEWDKFIQLIFMFFKRDSTFFLIFIKIIY